MAASRRAPACSRTTCPILGCSETTRHSGAASSPGLDEDLVGDRQLAEVVQEARGPTRSISPFGQVERPGQADRPLGDQGRGLARPGGRATRRPGGRPRDAPIAARPTSTPALAGLRPRWGAPHEPPLAGLAEDVDLVPPQRLGGIERRVGVPDQHVGLEELAVAAGHPGGEGDRQDIPAVEPDGADPTIRRSFSAPSRRASASVSGMTIRNSSPP